MYLNLEINKTKLASWIMALFAFTVLTAGIFSEFFQAPVDKVSTLEEYQKLIPKETISNIESLQVENKFGSFKLTKIQDQWRLVAPRSLKAKGILIDDQLSQLDKIKISKVIPSDAISLSNFALDNPLFSLIIKSGNKEHKLRIGLYNPIDNTSYIMYEDKRAIYQTSGYLGFSAVDFTSFIDSSIFPSEIEEVKKLTITRGRSSRARLSLLNVGTQWRDNQGILRLDESVKAYLTDLSLLNASIILDSMDEKLIKEVDKYFKNSAYKMNVELDNGNKLNYEVSGLVRSLSGIKLERNQYYLIRSSSKEYPMLISKENIKFFQKRNSNFKRK